MGLEDTVRANTLRNVVQRLRDLGIRYIAIFTGDRLSVAKRVGQSVGVDAIEAECLPEEKHQLIKDMVKAGFRTMMVGDGINDGPSLAAADVGVAMGLSGSDIAANSAGVALMNDDLSRVPFLIELARRTRAITAQNIVASVLIALVEPHLRGDRQADLDRQPGPPRRGLLPLRGRHLRHRQQLPAVPGSRRGLCRAEKPGEIKALGKRAE